MFAKCCTVLLLVAVAYSQMAMKLPCLTSFGDHEVVVERIAAIHEEVTSTVETKVAEKEINLEHEQAEIVYANGEKRSVLVAINRQVSASEAAGLLLSMILEKSSREQKRPLLAGDDQSPTTSVPLQELTAKTLLEILLAEGSLKVVSDLLAEAVNQFRIGGEVKIIISKSEKNDQQSVSVGMFGLDQEAKAILTAALSQKAGLVAEIVKYFERNTEVSEILAVAQQDRSGMTSIATSATKFSTVQTGRRGVAPELVETFG